MGDGYIIHIFGVLSVVFYLFASLFFFSAIFRSSTVPFKIARVLLAGGFLAQSALIPSMLFIPEGPLLTQRGEYFFWLAWSIPLIYGIFRSKLDSAIVGAFLAPCTVLFLASSSYLLHLGSPLRAPSANGPLLLLHVVPALLAEISLVIIFGVSAAFLVQERRIKSKKATSVTWNGPSLEALDGMARRFVFLGFTAMGLAIVSGAIWAVTSGKSLLSGDYYQWCAIASWAVLAYILYLRTNLNWSGQRLSRRTLFLTGIFLAGFVFGTLIGGNEVHIGYGF